MAEGKETLALLRELEAIMRNPKSCYKCKEYKAFLENNRYEQNLKSVEFVKGCICLLEHYRVKACICDIFFRYYNVNGDMIENIKNNYISEQKRLFLDNAYTKRRLVWWELPKEGVYNHRYPFRALNFTSLILSLGVFLIIYALVYLLVPSSIKHFDSAWWFLVMMWLSQLYGKIMMRRYSNVVSALWLSVGWFAVHLVFIYTDFYEKQLGFTEIGLLISVILCFGFGVSMCIAFMVMMSRILRKPSKSIYFKE